MSETLDYILNDPMTPDLKIAMNPPALSADPKIAIQGWNGYFISDIQKQAAQVCMGINTTLEMVKKAYSKPIKWAATPVLNVIPRAGRGINAFYDRAALNFFFDSHPTTHKMVYCSESANVVSHELGHAILDSIRPDLWNVASLEVMAFHESFGDIISMLSTLQFDVVIEGVLSETQGKLRVSNVVSRIAEEMGDFVYCQGKRTVEKNALRNASNDYSYVAPSGLPLVVEDLGLTPDPHNFSRIFTGAWYECLVSIYEFETTNLSHVDSLKKARDIMAFVTLNSMSLAAANPLFYSAVAKSMLAVVQSNYGNDYFSVMRKVFLSRRIIRGVVMMPHESHTLDPLAITSLHRLKGGAVARTGSIGTGSLAAMNHGKLRVSRLPVELMEMVVEIPLESLSVVDDKNRIVDELVVDSAVAHESVRAAVVFLNDSGSIGDNGTFGIEDGRLVRRRSCVDKRVCRTV
jgi:hypothetical protein